MCELICNKGLVAGCSSLLVETRRGLTEEDCATGAEGAKSGYGAHEAQRDIVVQGLHIKVKDSAAPSICQHPQEAACTPCDSEVIPVYQQNLLLNDIEW